MLANERLAQRKAPARLRAPGEMTLLLTVAVAFFVLHILVGVILLRTPANGTVTPQEEARSASYD